MRITGGTYCGRKVHCPPGVIRPAMDRMRVSLFAILGPLEGLTFLDLFSGSGVIAIEALSRGASVADLVEQDRGKKTIIEKNLSWVLEPWKLHLQTVEKFIRTNMGKNWDIVYCDPPFSLALKDRLLISIVKHDLVGKGGILILHHPTEESLPSTVLNFSRYDIRKYGGSTISFFRLDKNSLLG